MTPSNYGQTQRTPLVQWPLPPNYSQEWLLTAAAPVTITPVGSTFVADIQGGSRKAGTTLQIWTPNNTNSQQFLWVALAGDNEGYYMILNAVAGMCLYWTEGQSYVQQQPWDSSDNAKWSKVPVPGSESVFIQNKGALTQNPAYSYLWVPPGAPSGCGVGYSVNPETQWTLSAAQFATEAEDNLPVLETVAATVA